MIKIEQDLYYFPQILLKTRSPYYMTYIEGTVSNLTNEKKTLTIHKFIVDTGAAITILNSSLGFLFKNNDSHIIDHVSIHYGGGVVKDPLPVYIVRIKIKGNEFDIPAAFDKNMRLPSLLGHYESLNNFDHVGISKLRRKLTMIKNA